MAEAQIAALEAEVAELRAYLPMLARMAFFERFAGESVPDRVLRIEDWTRFEPDSWITQNLCAELHRPKDEPLPAAGLALRKAGEARERETFRLRKLDQEITEMEREAGIA
jgi:hypothetical protein